MTAARVWSCKESYLHINILEMKTVILSLVAFLPQLLGQSVVLMSDNVTVVAYLQSEGGTVSRVLCHMALDIVLWTERQSVSLSARYIPGKKNVLVDPTQSSQPVFPTEWSLLPRVFEAICEFFGHPHLKLFTTRANAKLSLYILPVMNPMIRKQDTIQHRWDHLSAYAVPLFALLQQVLLRVRLSTGLLSVLVAPLWPQKEWFACLLSMLIDEPFELPQVWNLLVQPHMRMFHRGLVTLHLHMWKLSSVSYEMWAFLLRL